MAICDLCGLKEGHVEVVRTVHGVRRELKLCEDCLAHLGEEQYESSFSTNRFLTHLVDQLQRSAIPVKAIKTTTCSGCGMTYGQFRELGKLGCAVCYEAFGAKLEHLLDELQGTHIHRGSLPADHVHRTAASALSEAMNDAVARGDMQEAARIRDQIKELSRGDQS